MQQLEPNEYDLLVIGGGINGTAVARAAAVAGHKVLLVERDDLAQWTSSASTRLIHGGLRYLEHREFRLVRESLAERAILLRTAPHLVRPLEFRLPYVASMRPRLVLRAGLFLYDFLSRGGGMPKSRSVVIDDPLLKARGRGYAYWDARTNDARLVVLNARDAADAGADIRTHTALVSAVRDGVAWSVELSTGRAVRARAIVNAAGAWVEPVLHGPLGQGSGAHARLVRGSHLIIRRHHAGGNGWLLQQPDGRIVFAIPHEAQGADGLMLIGTTDVPASGPQDDDISEAEIDYLLAAANRYFAEPLTPADIVASYSGIRALFDDGNANASAVTRDYRLELDAEGPRLLSVFGGKLTTARQLAELALTKLGMAAGDTRHRVLPGGDMASLAGFRDHAAQHWPFLPPALCDRLAGAYGTRMVAIMGDATSLDHMGRDLGHGLTEREAHYLIAWEWARTAEDILRRRTDMWLLFSDAESQALDDWMEAECGGIR